MLRAKGHFTLWPPTAWNTKFSCEVNRTAKQTYFLFVQGQQHCVTSIQRRWSRVNCCHCCVCISTANENSIIPHTASDAKRNYNVNHTAMRTYLLFVQSQRHRFMYVTKIIVSDPIAAIVMYVFRQWMRIELWSSTASNAKLNYNINHTAMQTYLLFVQSQRHRFMYLTKTIASRLPSIRLVCVFRQPMRMRIEVWPYTASNAKLIYKRTFCSLESRVNGIVSCMWRR